MNLDDLSASELSAIDSVCLEFERRFGTDTALSIEQAVDHYLSSVGQPPSSRHVELLRQELAAIETELQLKRDTDHATPGFAPTPFQSSVPTQSIGPYSISGVLARGGMGIVYRAFDTRLDRPVAIKMLGFQQLSPTDPKRIELVERFEREAKAVAALSHPNIVELFDVGVEGDVPYAVMEFLNGSTLADQLAGGPMSAEKTCQIGMQIAGALATAHASGVIHRDLKPQNVMLVENNDSGKDASVPRVKLVDFGLSRISDSALSGALTDVNSDNTQTRSGMILGTPGYMAPEQARGESATSAADMFGFGCVLYEVFYGKQAIPGETPADRLAGTLRGEVQYDESGCKKSKLICGLIAECLSKDPADRPTATDVYGRLRQVDLSGARSGGAKLRTEPRCDGDTREGVLRRHMMTTLVGGLLGGMLGGFSRGKTSNPPIRMGAIESIAVLTLRDDGLASDAKENSGMPLAGRKIADGEILSSALVNELSAVDGLTVLPFRPLSAETPQQFIDLGRELEVDAFVTGALDKMTVGQDQVWVLNWKLVSAANGKPLVDKQFITERQGDDGGRYLAQSAAATDIAKQIGRALVTTGSKSVVPDPAAYGCMMKGHAYADADSTEGLKQALSCFENAHREDPRLSEPLAAIAVASLNLAARSNSAEALAHLEKARSSMTEALEKDPSSVDARIAEAMLEWQSLHHYEEADRLFAQLHREAKFNFQVQHQRGLLLATLGQESAAIDALRTASKLHPMSMLIKTDRCRVDWFFGYDTRAIRDVLRYRDATPKNNPARALAVGLLIDFYEQQTDYESAAEQQGFVASRANPGDYYRQREDHLSEYPYGPFGVALNRAIFDLRVRSGIDEDMLGVLNESGGTMFPLLLARHPAFVELRMTEAAAAYLPEIDGPS